MAPGLRRLRPIEAESDPGLDASWIQLQALARFVGLRAIKAEVDAMAARAALESSVESAEALRRDFGLRTEAAKARRLEQMAAFSAKAASVADLMRWRCREAAIQAELVELQAMCRDGQDRVRNAQIALDEACAARRAAAQRREKLLAASEAWSDETR